MPGGRPDRHQVDGYGRLRTPGGAGCFLTPGAGIRRSFATGGFASWAEWLTHVGVPPEERDGGAYIEDPDGLGPGISFLKAPEPKVAKNRVHLDVQAGGVAAGPGRSDGRGCLRRSSVLLPLAQP